MKKVISLMLCLIMLVSSFSLVVFAEDNIKITIFGKEQTYDVMPKLTDGRVLVPMRGIFESLGATVLWEESTKTVTGKKGDIEVVVKIGEKTAKVNGKDIALDVPAKIFDNRTFVPIRFISESLGQKVDWDDSNKNVIITSDADKSKMATLISDVHRDVPKEFTKSSSMDDLMFFGEENSLSNDELYLEAKKTGETVCSTDKFMDNLVPFDCEYGHYEVFDIENMPFKKAMRITCTLVPSVPEGYIIRTTATPEKNIGDGVKKEDIMLLSFWFRRVSGGDEEGRSQVQFQIEHPVTYKKALLGAAFLNDTEWHHIYMPFTGVDDATSLGIRPAYSIQTIELGGMEIINMGPNYDIKKLPETKADYTELKRDAEWRKEAIERIEKIRKGDFKVKVVDKDGNCIPNASVTFDMFEHEFKFGTCINGRINENMEYRKYLNRDFNSCVTETNLKWAPYEGDKTLARKEIENAKASGIKYVRGHCLYWDRNLGSNGVLRMTPDYMYTDEILHDRKMYDEKTKKHFEEILSDYYGEITDWDVVNEIVGHFQSRKYFDDTVFIDYFKWARDNVPSDCDLYYNECVMIFDKTWIEYLDKFKEMNVDYDGVGIQSHYDSELANPTKMIEFYNLIRDKYGKKVQITEYSNSISDKDLQANYMRDMLISAFAQDNMTGFLMWGFWDGSLYAGSSPMYDKDWNLKPAGEVYEDMIYNKWWTKNAKASTDENGLAFVRGYYGDYDVTVSANGKTKTVSCAYHSGYDNTLEIVMD